MSLPPLPPPSGSHPVMLLQPFVVGDVAAVEHYRTTSCENYSECLGYVCRIGWPNFSCRECALFVEEPHTNFDVDNVVRLIVESTDRKGPTDASPSSEAESPGGQGQPQEAP